MTSKEGKEQQRFQAPSAQSVDEEDPQNKRAEKGVKKPSQISSPQEFVENRPIMNLVHRGMSINDDDQPILSKKLCNQNPYMNNLNIANASSADTSAKI